MALALKEEFGHCYTIKAGELRYCTLKLASWFDSSAKIILPMWGKVIKCDN